MYQRNIGFSKCKMKTNKQTNRELICTWGFYEAKKERFMDDDKNKQKNKQTNKQRQYSMIKRMENYFEFLSVEPEDGE